MASMRAKANEKGELVLPAEILHAAGIRAGEQVILQVLGAGRIEAFTPEASIAAAQKIVARHARKRSGIVDELLAERRSEAESE